MATVELTQTDVGEFEAEKIQSFSSKKLVHLKGVYTHGYVLPEQGTWHLERKKKILLKHPEVKQLYGQNPWTAALMVLFLVLHTWVAVKISSYSFPVILITSYAIGSWWSFVLQAIGHEATHRLIFKSAVANKVVAMLAFLPVFHGAFGTIWMYEHMWHHNVVVDKCIRYGEQQNGAFKKMIMTLLFIVVIDLIVAVSGALVLASTVAGIVLYLAGKQSHVLPKTCALPPYKTFTQAINVMTLINVVLSFAYHIILYRYAGGWAWFYVAISSYWCNGLHPLGMRQVQEHYFVKKDQPTYSIYSPVHLLCLNLGHHVEHHDFPTIPWNRLPALRALAPEFYDTLYYHKSYTQVLWDFLTTPGIPLSVLFEDSVITPEALATSEVQFSS